MSTIVVKNFPDDLHNRLKERAERNHRSMTKEVVHLIAAGLGSRKMQTIEQGDAAGAAAAMDWVAPPDGRAALRAALIKQRDGSYINVLGIEDTTFFDTLDRIRTESQAPDVRGMFGENT